MRWIAPLALATVAAIGGCGGGRAPAGPTAAACDVVRGMPGPEDLELDRRDPRGPRLLVSSLERRGPITPGALFAVPLSGGALGPPKVLELVGRDAVAFRPHGISLVPAARPPLLYVVNHVTESEHAIEVFEIDGDRLRFRRRLTDPLVTTPNDVVALADGHVYVTNTGPSQGLGGFLSMLLGLRRGTVAHFDGQRWTIAARDISYANGVAVNATGDRLYVAGVRDEAIHELRRRPETGAIDARLRTIEVGSGVDNLTWAGEHALLVAAHPKAFAFLRHMGNAAKRAPSEVYRVDVRDGSVTRLYADDGRTISAASTAIAHDGRLSMGQVFDDAVVACPLR